jgi:hypothetical protein
VATDPSPFSASQFPDSIGAQSLSITVIGPDDARRSSAMIAIARSWEAMTRDLRILLSRPMKHQPYCA